VRAFVIDTWGATCEDACEERLRVVRSWGTRAQRSANARSAASIRDGALVRSAPLVLEPATADADADADADAADAAEDAADTADDAADAAADAADDATDDAADTAEDAADATEDVGAVVDGMGMSAVVREPVAMGGTGVLEMLEAVMSTASVVDHGGEAAAVPVAVPPVMEN
jgi:hypothetical protein